ncbi:MAG: hypothetical protein NVS3B27_11120 [Novosphingobium sp.]
MRESVAPAIGRRPGEGAFDLVALPGKPPAARSEGVGRAHSMAGILTGKVALVTGASSGIGAAAARALAAAGAAVALSARRADR